MANGRVTAHFDNDDQTYFAKRVRISQRRLTDELKPHYDFIVCGSGSSGSMVAHRLAENPDVSVLLFEAGGTDEVSNVMEANQGFTNLGSQRDWGFVDQPNPSLNGRSIPLNMGKVLGGGSSVTTGNTMAPCVIIGNAPGKSSRPSIRADRNIIDAGLPMEDRKRLVIPIFQ